MYLCSLALALTFGLLFLAKRGPTAILWYRLATRPEQSPNGMGFVHTAWHTRLPHLKLCICYDRLGDCETAYYHNEMARKYGTDSPKAQNNKRYLETVMRVKKAKPEERETR